MKDTKTCPKCNGEMELGEEYGSSWKPLKQLTFFKAIRFYTYVCLKCGYMESYLNRKDK